MTSVERYLEGQHAVVTGGSRGIGVAIARALLARGARITIMARTYPALALQATELRREQGAKVSAMECDVTSEASVTAAFGRAVAELGPVHVLVNNAGMAESVRFTEMRREVWDRIIATNLTGTYLCTAQVLSAMLRARSGRVVNIASTAGLRGYKTTTAYCAAKHGVIGLTRSLALEAAKNGVTVNAVCPGYTEGDMTDTTIANLARALGRTDAEARAMLVRTIPRGTLISPAEVAGAVCWLCSPDAAAVTGVALPVAGGEAS